MTLQYQVCQRCVMDTSDPGISFDEPGICSHCRAVEERKVHPPFNLSPTAKKQELEKLINLIKESRQNRPYDCVVGISGGVDSTFTVFKSVQLGLKPLVVHLDNGWNSELAVHNIEKVCKKLQVDLITHVIDWLEFRDIQLSFLRASTPDSEIPTDLGITAILYQVAQKNKIKYIITGDNYNTESILPFAWSHGHYDWKYVKSIHKRFGSIPFKTFPRSTLWQLFYYRFIKHIHVVQLLDYLDYHREQAVNTLKEELQWQPYKSKHHESIYTKFYQAYILPQKFGFDKRRAHLSSLIHSGEMTRPFALQELKKPLYEEKELAEDKEYVIAKLGITPNEFDQIMKAPPKSFWDYPSYENSWYYKLARILYRLLTGKWRRSTQAPKNEEQS